MCCIDGHISLFRKLMCVGAGKYTKDNLPGGARALVINEERVNAVQPLLGLMRDIGSAHGGKTPGQVGP
jgi:hypothetical protein